MMLNRKKIYKFYNSIMNLDDKIRFITIIDKSGVIIFGGQREGVENYLSEEAQKNQLNIFLILGSFEMNYLMKYVQENMPLQNMNKSKDLRFH